jgi:hypothetical protein
LLSQRQREILRAIAKQTGSVHYRLIARTLGSASGLKEDLTYLVTHRFVRKEIIGKYHYFTLLDRGRKELLEAEQLSFAESVEIIRRLQSGGNIVDDGEFLHEHDEFGRNTRLFRRDPKTGKITVAAEFGPYLNRKKREQRTESFPSEQSEEK